jgi:hypothetical protein
VGLALTDRGGAALALAVCGLAVIGTVDNLVRPLLARPGSLRLPTYVVLVAMFAGVQVIGAWGLLVAPSRYASPRRRSRHLRALVLLSTEICTVARSCVRRRHARTQDVTQAHNQMTCL